MIGASRRRVAALLRTDAPPALRWLAWVLVAVGGLNAVVLLAQARDTIRSLNLNPDNAMSLVLPSLASRAGAGAVITLGNHAYYETWWFTRATIGLPWHRAIWEGAPFVVEGAGIVVVMWCAWVALGRLAALLAGVALVCVPDGLRAFLAMPSGRVQLALHAGALCAALLLVARAGRERALSRRALAALTLFTVLFGAVGASDQLIAITVVAPYVFAAVLWWWCTRTEVSRLVGLYAIATAAVAAIGAIILTAVMHAEHVVHAPFPILFTASADLVTNVENMVSAWTVIGGGSFFGLAASGQNLITFVAGCLCLLALAGVVVSLSRRVRPLLLSTAAARAVAPGRFLYVAFWGAVLAFDAAIYLLTQLSSQAGNGDNYLLSAWVAVAALLGAFARSSSLRGLLVIAVALFALIAFRTHVKDGVPVYGAGPDRATAAAIEDFARSHGARIGYASYQDAPVISWETALKAQVYPLAPCNGPASGLCAFYIGISSWYTPRPRTSTFLVTDSGPAVTGGAVAGTAPVFGKPVASETLGALTVYVYNHDIAASIGP
jgi:hypothetical protein